MLQNLSEAVVKMSAVSVVSFQGSTGEGSTSKVTYVVVCMIQFPKGLWTEGKFLIGYWLLDLLASPYGIWLHQSRQVRGRERQRMSKMEVIVFYKLILEGISLHILHALLVRSKSSSLAHIQEEMISQGYEYQEWGQVRICFHRLDHFLFIYQYHTVA